MATTPEAIARSLLSNYTSNFAAELATVQADWASTRDIELVDFATRKITADPIVVPSTWLYPVLLISPGELRERPLESTDMPQLGQASYDMVMAVFYYLKDIDAEQLAFRIERYIEATLSFLQNYGNRVGDSTTKKVTGSFTATKSFPRRDETRLVKGVMFSWAYRTNLKGF